ncbi:MAG: alpha/beta hydrolase, partial [Bacteroidetes bacterium]|nr:alpha/beta hydrolase [Bacteroidota bacterium]
NITPRGIVARFVKEVYGDEKKVTDELIDRYQDLFLINGNRKAFIAIANTKFERNEDKIIEIKTPTLILWGAEDKWIPIEHAYRFKDELPNARLIVYEGVGHIPMEEIPKQSAKDVRLFLRD